MENINSIYRKIEIQNFLSIRPQSLKVFIFRRAENSLRSLFYFFSVYMYQIKKVMYFGIDFETSVNQMNVWN